MKRLAMIVLSLSLLALVFIHPGQTQTPSGNSTQTLQITRNGSQPSRQGPAENFTGSVRINPLFSARAPSRVSGGSVTFNPGARTAWHTHPLGQTLIVTSGVGRVQQWGGPIQEIRRGDVVWFPPGLKHWHGASPNAAMTHTAIQEESNGTNAVWMEKVTDEQYNGTSTPRASALPVALPAASPSVTQPNVERRRLSPDDVRRVAPAFEQNTQELLYGEVWKRPGLSPRDRSLVTITALIARNLSGGLPYYFNQAIENGVKPREISEIITHLAFYSGWANAFAAVGAARDVFAERGIGPDRLPAASVPLLRLDEAAEAQRAAGVSQQFGTVAPGIVQYTTDALFRNLWLRPDLAPRDRSLVTVSALIAAGQVAQIPYHLNRAMDNGLTQEQTGEVITQLAFYAGWPNAFSALPVAKEVFQQRS
jgi:4-carboxymuconolactone decarboxylase